MDLVVRFGLRRFLFRYKAFHTAVRTLSVMTSAFKQVRLTQSCNGNEYYQKTEPVQLGGQTAGTYPEPNEEMILEALLVRRLQFPPPLHLAMYQSASQNTGSHCHREPSALKKSKFGSTYILKKLFKKKKKGNASACMTNTVYNHSILT